MRPWLRVLGVAGAVLAGGCVTEEQIIGALNDVNQDFRLEYERILLEKGTRVYRVPRGAAYAALQGALGRVGMQIADQSADIGYLSASGPAPPASCRRSRDCCATCRKASCFGWRSSFETPCGSNRLASSARAAC